MNVSKTWLKELVDLKVSIEEVERLLPLRTIGTKEITEDFIELDMKGYNRADLLSMRGVAFEVSAITDSQLQFGDTENYIWNHHSLPQVNVKVESEKLVPVYCIAKIEGLKVGPSSENVKKKLSDSGIRSVNNVTDITNLIMLEYGQPLHAFDADTIKDETIVVRNARDGEKLTTLDNKERILKDNDLLITDPEKILGLAGIMGGKDSEIKDSTTTIFLEAAIFDPISIRKTATRLGLNSEAAKRFQHGLTIKNLLQALDQAIIEYQIPELGGKLTAISIVGNINEGNLKTIKLDLGKLNRLIGIEINEKDVRNYLEKLGFKVSDSWNVEVPYWRLDINYQEDLIEEVARLYGYERIPAAPLKGELPEKVDQSLFENIHQLRTKLTQLGLTEIQTYSFFSTKVLSSLGWDKNSKFLVKVANPMSAETTYLRQALWPNLVEVIDKNLRQGFKDQALFEIGKVYMVNNEGEIDEHWCLSGALMNETDNPLAELNQIVKQLDLNVEIKETEQPEVVKGILHPKRFLKFEKDGEMIGGMSEVHPRYLDNFGINQRVAVFEIII